MLKPILITMLLLTSSVHAQSSPKEARVWDGATVYRDEWGVPHVYANTPHALAFAFGYAQAQDHLEDMLRAYRVANGRASEVYGPAFIASDTHALIMRHYDLAEAAYTNLDALTKNLCDGFSGGVNSWIIEHPDDVPEWAEGVSPVDILSLLHHYLTSMAPLDDEQGYIPAKGTPLGNAWALDASRTQAGNPILVMNPHTDYDGIFQWYEAHLVTRNTNVYGATIFGLPVLLMGHNRDVAWALSPNEPDTAEVYYVVDDEVPYTRESDTHPLHVWENRGLKEYSLDRPMTWYGPVLRYERGVPVVYKVGGYRDFGGLRQLYDMGRARSLPEFQTAWDRQQLPMFHVIYADRDNNIFYNYNAKVGNKSFLFADRTDTARLSPTQWESPLATDEPGAHWGETLTLEDDLPWILNPESGYIQASGTPPWLVTEGMEWTEDDFDDWLIRDPDSYRAKRLRQVLSQGQRSFKDNQAMLYDVVVPLASEVVPFLVNAAAQNPTYVAQAHPDLHAIINRLKHWDYQAHPDSEAMTFFHVWWTLCRLEYAPLATSTESLHALLSDGTPLTQRYLLESAANAARLMHDYYQTVQVLWGDVHVIKRGKRTAAIGGAYTGGPLFGTGDHYFEHGKWIAKQGPAFSMIVELGNTPKSVSSVPFGSSQDPNSEHYADQLTLMQERRFKRTHFNRNDVERHSVSARGKLMTFRRGRSGISLQVRARQVIDLRLGLATQLEVALPEGYAAFSPYVEAVALPLKVPIENTLAIHIPASLCTQETLGELGVFAYSPQTGWVPVSDQEVDFEKRSFYAWGYDREVYALLGPKDLLLQPLSQETYDDFLPDRVKLASLTSSSRGSAEFLQSAPASLSPEEQARIAQAHPKTDTSASIFPDIFEITRTHHDGSIKHYTPFGEFLLNGLLVPATPPGWKDFLRNQQLEDQQRLRQPTEHRLPPRQTMINAGGNSPAPLSPKIASNDQPPSPVETSPKVESTDLIQESPILTPSASTPKSLEELASIRPNKSRQEKAEARNPFHDTQGGLLFEAGLPNALTRTSAERGPKTLVLAPDRALATRLIVDKEFVFTFPRFGANFELSMDKTVRAQMAFRPQPAEPYPNQLVPFTPLFDVFYAPLNAPGILSISMRVLPGICAPENFAQLQLYAYDPEFGWQPVPDASTNPDRMSFVALDFAIRSYTVLGPQSARITAPQMLPE